MRPRIFVPGAFTYQNKGDELLVLSLVRSLRARWSSADIRLASLFPEIDRERYGVPVGPEPLRRLRDLGEAKTAVVAVAASWLFVATSLLWTRVPAIGRLLPESWRSVLREAREADFAVAVPGGYMMAQGREDFWWLSHFCAMWACVASRTPVILSPCSIGPFAPRYRRLARLLLRRVDLIVLREQRSLRFVLDLGVDPRRVQTATDMAFALEPEKASSGVGTEAPRIGMAVRRWGFPGQREPSRLWERYVRAMARAAEWAVTELGAKVVLIAQAVGTGGDDAEVSRAVLGASRQPQRMQVIDEDLDLQALWAVYGELDLLIGTRMHANLLALTCGVPVVAVAYEAKTWGIMEDLGLERHVIDISDVSPKSLVELAAETWAAREAIRAQIRRRLPHMRRRATAWLDGLESPVE